MSLGPINAPALAELCALLETSSQQLLPDAVWLGGRAALYQRLRDCEALSLAADIAPEVLCPDCQQQNLRPQPLPDAPGRSVRFQALCFECGELSLSKERVRLWQAHPAKVAHWLHLALGLRGRYDITECVPGVLWHLGDCEIRRHRRSFFFGCRLKSDPERVRTKLAELAAPGAAAVITTTEAAALRASPVADCLLIPLRAVAQLRKGHLTLEPLEPYFDGLALPVTSDETTLRLLHSRCVALIGGVEHKVSSKVADFIKVLQEADGDEVHKRKIASALGISATFRYADIRKRHKAVFDTFVQSDQKGNFWLLPQYLILDRR